MFYFKKKVWHFTIRITQVVKEVIRRHVYIVVLYINVIEICIHICKEYIIIDTTRRLLFNSHLSNNVCSPALRSIHLFRAQVNSLT